MNGQLLHLSDEVCHLGHILSFNLCDRNDILRATKDFNRKSNYILSTFNCVDPSVKSFLVKSFCLSLYGCNIWSLSSPDLNILQVAVNHLLRRSGDYCVNLHCHLSLSLSRPSDNKSSYEEIPLTVFNCHVLLFSSCQSCFFHLFIPCLLFYWL